ncbi:MAG: tRNA 2-thiocytidine(32) synthetase TtcA [Treponema sp. CETP13]|nr:MAG: tRNA 2-thiocytidine(32) synthetase TtcA [Treponema sp. CETP13]
MAQPKIFSLMDKAIHEYNLIEKGDKILIGASGGKDSTALVEYFASRKHQKRPNDDFEFMAIHIAPGFADHLNPKLVEQFEHWGVDFKTINIDVLGRLKPGKKMNCWWCSTQRRTELNNYAMEHGYNKIALGHHLDDILETLLMNALKKGQLSTMPPRLKYKKYPVTVIRPLCFATDQSIVDHAEKVGYKKDTTTCTYDDNSTRKKARSRLYALTEGNEHEKLKFFEALRNINTEYLP